MALSHLHWTLSTIFELDYSIEATCVSCGETKVKEPEEIAQHASWETRMEEVARRWKCERCRRRTEFQWRLVTRHPLSKREARDRRNG